MNNEKKIKPSERIKELSNKWKNVNFGFDLSYVMAIVDFMDEQHAKKSSEEPKSFMDIPIEIIEDCPKGTFYLVNKDYVNNFLEAKKSDEKDCIYCANTGIFGNKKCPYCKPSPSSEPVNECNCNPPKKFPNNHLSWCPKFKEPLVDGKEVSEGYIKVKILNSHKPSAKGNIVVGFGSGFTFEVADFLVSKQPAQRTLSVEEIYAIINSYKMFDKFTVNGISQRIHSAMLEKIGEKK